MNTSHSALLDDIDDSAFLAPPFIAKRLAVARSTIYTLISAGELPAVRVGKSLRVNARALKKFLSESEVAR